MELTFTKQEVIGLIALFGAMPPGAMFEKHYQLLKEHCKFITGIDFTTILTLEDRILKVREDKTIEIDKENIDKMCEIGEVFREIFK